MLEYLLKKGTTIFLLIIHLLIGFVAAYNKQIIGLYYVLAFTVLSYDVLKTGDKNSRAGFYALYLMGFEIIYRIAGVSISWEFGKYVSILMLITGLISGKRKMFPYIYLVALFLLLPAVFITDGYDISRIRKNIMFNISGPLSLIFSGIYFYKRRINYNVFFTGLRFAFLPALSLIAVLTFKSSISDLEYSSIQSSTSASGGFGANQVSTVLGWFLFLGSILLINRKSISGNLKLDWLIVGIILLRGLLTFSRGGIMAAVLSIFIGVSYAIITNSFFRKKMFRIIGYAIIGLVFLGGVLYYANSLTNNLLLYRYQGKTTKELRTGVVDEDKDVLTGRSGLMEADIVAFKENLVLGTGYGGSMRYHEMITGQALTAHTEYTRLLAENGLLGLLYMLIFLVVLPLNHFFMKKNIWATMFFIGFIIISYATMLHAAMRLALPGIAYGAAFMLIVENKKTKKRINAHPIHRQ